MESGSEMTHRERILAAMKREAVDYVPCVPVFNPLRERQRKGYRYQFPWGPTQRERCEYLVNELGVGACYSLEISPIHPAAGVSARVWMEDSVIHKVWSTPSGELHAAVRYDEKWPNGLEISLYDDFLIAHSVTHWLENEHDLECLRHILRAPDRGEEYERLRFNAMEARRTADELRVPIITCVGLGLTGGMHLIGPAEICMMAAERPALLHDYLQLEHEVNLRCIDLAADLGVHIVNRDGFYETADFYSPKMLDAFVGEFLRGEARAACEAGLVTTYTINTGLMPIRDYLATLEFDCFDSIDIAFRDFDLAQFRDSQGGKRSYWIGPSSVYHIWKDDPELTRAAVRQCFEVLGKRGLLIKACPSSHSIMPWGNTLAMINEWKKWR